jgi:hypothetical protein
MNLGLLIAILLSTQQQCERQIQLEDNLAELIRARGFRMSFTHDNAVMAPWRLHPEHAPILLPDRMVGRSTQTTFIGLLDFANSIPLYYTAAHFQMPQ